MKKKILIVDDDVDILGMLKLTLNIWCPECEIVSATNGLRALIQFQLHDEVQPFDVVLTDYDMPVMNGLDLAYEIRQKWPHTHIILMSSGQFDKIFQKQVDAHQVDNFVRKPFIMRQIKQLIFTDSKIFH